MPQPFHSIRRPASPALLLASLFFVCWQAHAKAVSSPSSKPAAAPLTPAFASLAAQRPWACPTQENAGAPADSWAGEPAECAWQNRLRMRRWQGHGDTRNGACISEQARWWAWARGQGSTVTAWRSSWQAQSIETASGAEKRIVILGRMPDGRWSATEWRWNPSPRAATRRWQEGRWALLEAHAAQLRLQAQSAPIPADTRLLRDLWEGNLGARPGEIGDAGWRWKAQGLCLRVDMAGLGQQQLELPYAVEDSRLEQRAAMQLQLARRHPKATWLTTFRLVPAAPRIGGGAKFYAVWLEQGTLKGQLWMPTRGGGPMVRLRIDTVVAAPGAAAPPTPALARAGDVIGHELNALAMRWAEQHE